MVPPQIWPFGDLYNFYYFCFNNILPETLFYTARALTLKILIQQELCH